MWTGREDRYKITHRNMSSLSEVARFYLSKSTNGRPWYLSMNPDRMRTIFNECLERGRLRDDMELRIKKALKEINNKQEVEPMIIQRLGDVCYN